MPSAVAHARRRKEFYPAVLHQMILLPYNNDATVPAAAFARQSLLRQYFRNPGTYINVNKVTVIFPGTYD
jgi:hypothetical protein